LSSFSPYIEISSRRFRFGQQLADLLMVVLGVGAAAFGGMVLATHTGRVPTIWPANGVLLGILLTSQPRRWPAVLLAGLVSNMAAVWLAGWPLSFVIRLPLVNAMEMALALALLQHFLGAAVDLSKSAVLWRFALLAVVVAPLVSAMLNAAFALLSTNDFMVWRYVAIYFAHALGVVTVTPFIMAVRRRELAALLRREQRWLRILAIVALIGITTAVFVQTRYPLLFMIYPPLVFLVALSGLSGGALGLFIVTLLSLGFTVLGHGPTTLIHGSGQLERIIVVQLFASVAAILVLVLSASLAERDRVQAQLTLATETLARLAITDSLTGLANRRRLDEALDEEFRRAKRLGTPFSLLLLDVDRFKSYNDFYGHQAGDECLRQISALVAARARRPGDLAARYGGEEMAVLLSPSDAAVAADMAEALRADIEACALPHEGRLDGVGFVTVSIGVGTYDPLRQPHWETKTLISRADEMLYEAKRHGRNRVVSDATAVSSVPGKAAI
jgi:diguanylate cyclase (GGDEF)-like protein